MTAYAAIGVLSNTVFPGRTGAAAEHLNSNIAAILRELYGNIETLQDKRIHIDIPARVEDGGNVPLTIDADVNGSDSLSILVDKNPRALAAQFSFSGALIYLRTRIRVAESSDVHVVLRSNEKLLSATRHVTLASGAGGCSGKDTPEQPILPSQIGEVKTRLVRKNDRKELSLLIRHPMETGFRGDPKTKQKIPAHYIDSLKIRLNDAVIIDASVGSAISRNPLFVFAYPAGNKQDEIEVAWSDTLGLSGSKSIVEKI